MSDQAPVPPERREHPTDKYARSDQAQAPRGAHPEDVADERTEDIVEEASEGSFPTSDPPTYTRGTADHTTGPEDGDEEPSA